MHNFSLLLAHHFVERIILDGFKVAAHLHLSQHLRMTEIPRDLTLQILVSRVYRDYPLPSLLFFLFSFLWRFRIESLLQRLCKLLRYFAVGFDPGVSRPQLLKHFFRFDNAKIQGGIGHRPYESVPFTGSSLCLATGFSDKLVEVLLLHAKEIISVSSVWRE